MKINNCRTIVFSSSAAIYGKNNKNPLREDATINPVNPYGRTKAAIEEILKDLNSYSSMSWRIANLRYFNPLSFTNRINWRKSYWCSREDFPLYKSVLIHII